MLSQIIYITQQIIYLFFNIKKSKKKLLYFENFDLSDYLLNLITLKIRIFR